jgi:adenine C2-methylase RlmN of 23S rRNA A2503 and tRNA A37
MTKEQVKTAAHALAHMERIEYGRKTVAVRACGEDIAELIDEDALERIKAAIDTELAAAADAMRKQLAAIGVDA